MSYDTMIVRIFAAPHARLRALSACRPAALRGTTISHPIDDLFWKSERVSFTCCCMPVAAGSPDEIGPLEDRRNK
eukprot:1089125-Prorocentrum_minimum.AAC.1